MDGSTSALPCTDMDGSTSAVPCTVPTDMDESSSAVPCTSTGKCGATTSKHAVTSTSTSETQHPYNLLLEKKRYCLEGNVEQIFKFS